MSETESVQTEAPAEAPEAAAPSIRDLAAAAYDEIHAAPEGESPAVETQSEGAARDERGRFAPKSEDQKPAETQTEQAAAPAIEMPSAWSAQHAERWKTLPREVQEHIAAREAEAHKAISEQGQQVARYKPLEDIIAPRRQALAAEGLNETQVVEAMFAIRDMLFSDPVQAISLLARQSGVNLSQLAGQSQQDQYIPQTPEMQRIAALEQHIAQQSQAATQAEWRSLSQQVEEFAKGKPDFQSVRQAMGRIVTMDPNKTLEQAYEEARWMVPEVRTQLLEQEKKATAERVLAEQRQRAEEAKRAAAINVRGGGERTASAPRSLRETLAASYDRAANA